MPNKASSDLVVGSGALSVHFQGRIRETRILEGTHPKEWPLIGYSHPRDAHHSLIVMF